MSGSPPSHPGAGMYSLIRELYPICRSITGNGLRETLLRIKRLIPLELHEVPSGTQVFDWTVPREWNVREAWIADASGRRIVDFADHSLHLVSYSIPVDRRISLEELRPHLHSLPAQPDLIPYRTSYYTEDWGFCLPHRQLGSLAEGEYQVRIDSTLAPGHLTYGELFLPGSEEGEVVVSCHSCHPSLANDNLAGIAVAVWLAQTLAESPRRHGFRFLFIPGTIGSITWLALNESRVHRIRHGLVLSCLGDRGNLTYKRSRRGNALVDCAAAHVLALAGEHEILDFTPYGYDERQYCSPGFDLPVGCLTRSPNGRFPEYHSSADNLDFVAPEALEDSLNQLLAIIEVLEHDRTFLNLSPRCEPQLGRRGLYCGTGGASPASHEMALLWVLNFSDGAHSLLEIAERAKIPFGAIRRAAEALEGVHLLQRCGGTEDA